MSGGAFDYNQYIISQIVDSIEDRIFHNGSSQRNEHGDLRYNTYDRGIIEEFMRAVNLLRQAEVYATRIDWLLSGDDGEDAFRRRLKKDLQALKLYQIDEQNIFELDHIADANKMVEPAEQEKCKCVYATSANTESVRKGYEMGGYLKQECEFCKRRDAKAEKQEPAGEVAQAVKTWPERIWLQHGDSPDVPDYNDCQDGVSWCWHSIEDSDVEYVRADLAALSTPPADNAPWLTKAHALCADMGVPPGALDWRLDVLRGLLEEGASLAAPQPQKEQPE